MDHPLRSAVYRLSSIVEFKTKSSPSVRDERGLPWCHPGLKHLLLTKNPCCDATGERASFTLSDTPHTVVISLLCNGSSRIGLVALLRSSVQLGGPFDFCAFASLSELPLGSLVIALKCTRPRQRFYVCDWAVFYDGAGDVSRGRFHPFINNLRNFVK